MKNFRYISILRIDTVDQTKKIFTVKINNAVPPQHRLCENTSFYQKK